MGSSERDEPGAPRDREGAAAGEVAHPGDARPAGTCELCGAPVLDRHCKLVCTGCGYQRDCSDP